MPRLVTDTGDSMLVVGETGWICRAQDDDDLVRVLRSAIARREELLVRGPAARERIVSEFSVERLVRATSEQFRGLLDDT